eukprot:gene23770-9330_t
MASAGLLLLRRHPPTNLSTKHRLAGHHGTTTGVNKADHIRLRRRLRLRTHAGAPTPLRAAATGAPPPPPTTAAPLRPVLSYPRRLLPYDSAAPRLRLATPPAAATGAPPTPPAAATLAPPPTLRLLASGLVRGAPRTRPPTPAPPTPPAGGLAQHGRASDSPLLLLLRRLSVLARLRLRLTPPTTPAPNASASANLCYCVAPPTPPTHSCADSTAFYALERRRVLRRLLRLRPPPPASGGCDMCVSYSAYSGPPPRRLLGGRRRPRRPTPASAYSSAAATGVRLPTTRRRGSYSACCCYVGAADAGVLSAASQACGLGSADYRPTPAPTPPLRLRDGAPPTPAAATFSAAYLRLRPGASYSRLRLRAPAYSSLLLDYLPAAANVGAAYAARPAPRPSCRRLRGLLRLRLRPPAPAPPSSAGAATGGAVSSDDPLCSSPSGADYYYYYN